MIEFWVNYPFKRENGKATGCSINNRTNCIKSVLVSLIDQSANDEKSTCRVTDSHNQHKLTPDSNFSQVYIVF